MNPNTILAIKAQIAILRATNSELDEDEQLREDMIAGETDFHNVMRQLLRDADEAAAFEEALAGVLRDVHQRKERLVYRVERLRGAMLSLMNAANLMRLPLPEATISVVQRGPSPMRPENVDGLPDEYVRIKREPNMIKIKAAIAAGEKIPGITMSNGSTALLIRR